MKEVSFSYEYSLIETNELVSTIQQLSEERSSMYKSLTQGYNDERASLSLVSDKEMLQNVKELVQKKQHLHPTYVIVAGIGGSHLGTVAVQEALQGSLYNQQQPPVKMLFVDTVDADRLQDVISLITPVLQNGGNILLNGISKSGTTTETIANFEVLIALLQRYTQDYEKYVVVTTVKDSKFWNLALEKGFDTLVIPEHVGGRFSVFSPVGLFPLGMIGVDIDAFVQGGLDMRNQCLDKELGADPAAISAALLYLHYTNGKNIHDTFLFSQDLESFGKWYRQLMGESIGKQFARDGSEVFTGMTPTVSIGSSDLHSMAQLYLGGPIDKFTTFIRVTANKYSVALPDFQEYDALVSDIQQRSLHEIMNAIYTGTQRAYQLKNRPYAEIILPDKTASSLGQVMQMKMMEMMYLGALLKVNPFDQPNVEDYKRETRQILKQEKKTTP